MLHPLLGVLSGLLAAAVAAEPTPPQLRLPPGARPVRQAIELTLDPGLEVATGSTQIEVEIEAPTDPLWLNAAGLKVKEATIEQSGDRRDAAVVAGGDDFVGFSTTTPLAPGRALLRIAFEARVSRRDLEGIFAVQEGGAYYLFTQFQALAARKAFPCFDEPSFKIPWQLTLRVPAGTVALSNSPAVATSRAGAQDVVRFAETPPLPSYLVAFAVGPFEVVDLGALGRGRTPARLAVPRGRGADTAWARESTGPILALLEDYFDRPYPYAKLDQVAIPGPGFAMEHPGLVTYGQTLMIQRAADETIGSRRAWAATCAHELAHQWFGNLVTMAWWDDTWLNESFAGWLGDKVVDRFRPDWGGAAERASRRSSALEADSFASARRVRQPIESKDDIANAFDFVTYGKGQAVLEMAEAWLGEETFRGAARSYVERHAGGNATTADFVAALSAAAGRDVSVVLGTFLDQTGAPVVSAAVSCAGEPRLELRQRPYSALGSPPPAGAKLWQLPVCVRLPGRDAPACAVIAGEAGEIRLGAAAACPAWSFANAKAAGYYRVALDAAQARRLLEQGLLDAPERVALAGDLAALVASGDVAADDALQLVPLLSRDADRTVVSESAALVRALEPLVPDAQLEAFRRLVRAAYGERARSLGWEARPGDGEDTRLLRRTLVAVAAGLGYDVELERDAVVRVRRWLDDGSALDPELVTSAVAAAAGDRDLLARLLREVAGSGERERRERLLRGLGSTRDAAAAGQVLALTLDSRLDVNDTILLPLWLSWQRETRRTAFDFLKANYDALVSRQPQGEMSVVPFFPWAGAGLCTEQGRQEIEAFFAPRGAAVVGAPRVLAQVLESVDQCIARRRFQEPRVAAYLESLGGR